MLTCAGRMLTCDLAIEWRSRPEEIDLNTSTLESATPRAKARARDGAARPTVKDVAAQAGVASSAVCVVLNGANGGNTGVSAAARARILEAAQTLGYRRNGSAAAARSGRFHGVTLLLSTVRTRSFLPVEMLDGICEALAAEDLNLSISRVPDEKLASQGYIPKVLREQMSDGLLVNYTYALPEPLEQLIARHHIPAIWMNRKTRNDCVYPDDFGAGVLATRHLIELGHTRIAFSPHVETGHYSAVERRAGYETAMREAGLKPLILQPRHAGMLTMNEWRELAASWKSAPSARPTALVDYTPTSALAARLALAEVGLGVPAQISIVTFGPQVVDNYFAPLTTCLLPEHELGRVAVALLRQKIEAPDEMLEPQTVECQLSAATSSAPPVRTPTP